MKWYLCRGARNRIRSCLLLCEGIFWGWKGIIAFLLWFSILDHKIWAKCIRWYIRSATQILKWQLCRGPRNRIRSCLLLCEGIFWGWKRILWISPMIFNIRPRNFSQVYSIIYYLRCNPNPVQGAKKSNSKLLIVVWG